jgi:hypothetical protein
MAGIKDEANWTQINKTMYDLQATCFGFTEINTTFRGTNFQNWNSITQKTFHHSKMTVSEKKTAYKPIKTQGPYTTWTQQWMLLRKSKKSGPNKNILR